VLTESAIHGVSGLPFNDKPRAARKYPRMVHRLARPQEGEIASHAETGYGKPRPRAGDQRRVVPRDVLHFSDRSARRRPSSAAC
jgi:hypothetical protein